VPGWAAGVAATGAGVNGIHNAIKMDSLNQPNSERPAPATDNYRGRYQAARAEQGQSRLPEDWDVHHRIPQDYIGRPGFENFDFHDPANLQGVEGVRANLNRGVPNIHQQITNDWAAF